MCTDRTKQRYFEIYANMNYMMIHRNVAECVEYVRGPVSK